jgi:hypothetical protein
MGLGTYIDDYQRLKVRGYLSCLITKGQRVMCGLTTGVLVRSDNMVVGPPSRKTVQGVKEARQGQKDG